MTVSPSNIWKSASEAVRGPAGQRNKNLHIGGTLRDLYLSDNLQSSDDDFSRMLEMLDAEEAKRDH